jgi:hypothetical protein
MGAVRLLARQHKIAETFRSIDHSSIVHQVGQIARNSHCRPHALTRPAPKSASQRL